jgi:hypothetical protein
VAVELTADPGVAVALPATVERFVSSPGAADLALRVSWGEPALESFDELLFDSGALWRLGRRGDRLVYHVGDPKAVDLPWTAALLDQSVSCGRIILGRAGRDLAAPAYPLEYPLDELLVSHHLSLGRGLEVHAAGVVAAGGAAAALVGPSGAGKSTLARLWRDERVGSVLCDDRVVVREQDGEPRLFGTPWHGTEALASPGSARLGAVFLLRQAACTTLRPLHRVEAAARLLACSFLPLHRREAVEFAMAFLEELTAKVPCLELAFTPDRSAVAAIAGAVGPGLAP